MSFKTNLSTLAVGAALMVAAQANAANDVTLKVSGNVVPAACTPTLSDNGEVAFGSIASASIRHASPGNKLVQLGSRDITLNITCDAAASVGFKMVDNRASSVVTLSSTAYIDSTVTNSSHTQDYFGFGLGNATNNSKIGTYTITAAATNTTIDGKAASLVLSDDSGKSWRSGPTISPTNAGARIMSVATAGQSTPSLFTEMSMPLNIAVGVQTSDVLGFDEIVLDGSATLSMVYL